MHQQYLTTTYNDIQLIIYFGVNVYMLYFKDIRCIKCSSISSVYQEESSVTRIIISIKNYYVYQGVSKSIICIKKYLMHQVKKYHVYQEALGVSNVYQ